MKELGCSVGIPVLARVGLVVVAVTVGLILTLTVVIAQAPDFDSSYKTGPPFAVQGDRITYTIVAVNTGSLVANVVLSDAVPHGAAFVPGSCTYITQTGFAQACGPLSQMWREDFAAGDRITTAFAVRVTTGTMLYPLVNCAYLSWDQHRQDICHTTMVNSAHCYLPFVMRNFTPMPDLQVTSLTVEPSSPTAGQPVTITVVVQNVGRTAAGPFWIDLYDNPAPPPTEANQPFDQLCSGAPEDCYGISWYIDGGLGAGRSVILTSLEGYLPDYSRWAGCFVDSGPHDLYAFVDSWNDPVWYGAVLERNEGLDNRYGPVSINVGPAASGWSAEPTVQDGPIPWRPNRP